MDAILRPLARVIASPAPLSESAVDEGLARLRAVFHATLGAAAAERFEPPEEFASFLRAAGGAQHDHRYMTFWSLAGMIRSTEAWASMRSIGDPEERPADGPWVHFASYGDKHWLFLCCDRAHPEHGHVAEGYDIVPWMDEGELDYNMRAALIDPWGDESPPEARWSLLELLELLAANDRASTR